MAFDVGLAVLLALLALGGLGLLLLLRSFRETPEESPYAGGACPRCGGPLPPGETLCAECRSQTDPVRQQS